MTGILWPPRLPSVLFWQTVPRSRGSWEAFRLATELEPRPSHHLLWPIWEFRPGVPTNLVYYTFPEAYLISRYHLDYSQALSLSTLYSVDVLLERELYHVHLWYHLKVRTGQQGDLTLADGESPCSKMRSLVHIHLLERLASHAFLGQLRGRRSMCREYIL